MKNLFFLILFSLEIFSQNKPLISIYLDDNNVTIKCENAEIGDKKKINGKIYTVVNKSILVNMIKVADLTRKGFMSGDISTVMSPRTVITWAENYLLLNDIEYAFKLSFLNRCDDMERSIIEEYFQRSFGIDITDAKVVNVKE